MSEADIAVDELIRQRLQSVKGESTAATHIDLLAPPARLLRAVHRTPNSPIPPELGLAAPWLFTAGKGSPSLLHEILTFVRMTNFLFVGPMQTLPPTPSLEGRGDL